MSGRRQSGPFERPSIPCEEIFGQPIESRGNELRPKIKKNFKLSEGLNESLIVRKRVKGTKRVRAMSEAVPLTLSTRVFAWKCCRLDPIKKCGEGDSSCF